MQNLIDALIEILLWLPQKIYEWLVDIIETLLSLLPDIPIGSFTNMFGNLDSGILYFLNVLEFPLGLTIVFSAYLSRFILRRLPFIGG